MEEFKIGITQGDFNGIGLEVILKSLMDPRVLDYLTPIIYSSSKVVSYHKNMLDAKSINFHSVSEIQHAKRGRINVLNCWQEQANITLGQKTQDGGKFAYIALDRATRDLKEGLIDAMVTAPIHKEAMNMADFPYKGHTDYLSDKTGEANHLMMLVSDEIKLGLVSHHIPIREVPEYMSKEVIASRLEVFDKTLRMDFGIHKPSIAVLGLNPHASDGGRIGKEEEDQIRPAILEAKERQLLVFGPFSSDGFFASGQYKNYDGILAMYHDQGLIPFKLLSFGEGVNFTANLPVIRTSPDHGTAFDIVGQNAANPGSFRKAMFLARDIAKHRAEFIEISANPVKKEPKPSEEMNE